MGKALFVFALFFMLFNKAKADEGMWLLNLIDSLKIEGMGLELAQDEIFNINSSCLKDAIVVFGPGCTGEIISDQGLILTNHHCGLDAIQFHSSVENDYLENGFWAKTKDEELHTPDLTVKFLVKIVDVTDSIMKNITDDMTEGERITQIDYESNEIEEQAMEEDQSYDAIVESFYNNNKFYLVVTKEYQDVRLVGAPPTSIGKFGGDTDNWMWPRHNADFCLFRVYGDQEGNPAEYSEDNLPLKPRHSLSISIKGYNQGDFAFILGYPGYTYRYRTSNEVKEIMDIINSARINVRTKRLEIMLDEMLANDKTRIQYTTKYSRTSNYWKFSIGQNRGLDNLRILDEKKGYEQHFLNWVNSNDSLDEKYGEALNLIESTIRGRKPYMNALYYLSECFKTGSEAVQFASTFSTLHYSMENGNHHMEEKIENLTEDAREFYKDYDASIDENVTKEMLKIYKNYVGEEFLPSFYESVKPDKTDQFIEKAFAKSIFADSAKLFAFLGNPKYSVLNKDPLFRMSESVSDKSSDIYDGIYEFKDDISKGRRLYMAGLMEMEKDKLFYPDANFTMRFTYGTIGGYYPGDAVHYNYYTSLKGIMEKENPEKWEFVVPSKLKQLYHAKDYGRYGEGNVLKTCFITNNDITGGNSGSPVFNGKGEIIGLAFDGNWEAMSGDITYEPNLQRCINVDIRYVLFIIEKYAGASHLIEEMKIVE